jgi:hypothetical protein
MNMQQTVPAEPDQCWSTDEENFQAGTLANFLENNDHLVAGTTVWHGLVERPNNTHLCDANDVLELMADRAGDIAGEHADGYPGVSEEARIELDQLLSDWIDKHARPEFFTVSGITPYTLTETDFLTIKEAK